MTVAERLSYIPGFVDEYGTEVAAIERAGERLAERIEREQGKLTRGEGTPVYAPAEMAERSTAILEAAGAEFDAATQRYLTQSEREVADLEKQLAILDGFDPFDSLKPDEQQKAALRREFVREDALGLRPDEVERRARAALASGDKVAVYLWWRYVGERTGAGREGAIVDGVPRVVAAHRELVAVLRDLGAVFDLEGRAQKRREIEAKVRAAQALPLAVTTVRNDSSGATDRALEQYRRHLAARF
jgi:hypothetical protein